MISARDSGSMVFQSTLSVRRATYRDGLTTLQLIISIHALRKESDIYGGGDGERARDFNPRSP